MENTILNIPWIRGPRHKKVVRTLDSSSLFRLSRTSDPGYFEYKNDKFLPESRDTNIFGKSSCQKVVKFHLYCHNFSNTSCPKSIKTIYSDSSDHELFNNEYEQNYSCPVATFTFCSDGEKLPQQGRLPGVVQRVTRLSKLPRGNEKLM